MSQDPGEAAAQPPPKGGTATPTPAQARPPVTARGPKLDLSKIRHDLRTPINHILGYCEMLQEDDGLPTDFAPDLSKIHAGGRQLLALITEYFDEETFEARRSDVHRLCHELRTPVNQIIGYSEILHEDATELGQEQCLSDLRKIRDAAQSWLGLMEKQLLPGGSGIVSSPNPTSGVAELEDLPEVVPFESPAGRVPSRQWKVEGRLLVVDDDESNRDMLSRRLQNDGYTVEVAANGADALRILRATRFDLVLLDLIMPGLDGYLVLLKMKDEPALSGIPVIMLSALDQDGGIARCIEAGADDYLPKPFNPTLLRARLGACLDKKRLRDLEQATYHALMASQRQLAAELAEAGAYVASLLPARLSDGPVTTDWCFQSSTQLGGDSFGYHWIDADHFAIYLLDVCGHGVGAALLSVSALNILRSGQLLADSPGNPGVVLEALNQMFPMESQNQQYFTCWLGVYSRSTGHLVYASAGHPPALLIGSDGRRSELRTSAPPVGAFPEVRYPMAEIQVMPGSQLFVFSDGVYEISLPNGRTGTLQDLAAALTEASSRADFSVAECLTKAMECQGTQALGDDYSLVRFRFET